MSVCNGSVAIDLALKALGVGPGDEVILAAYDSYSLPKSVLNLGTNLVFVDVTPGNLTIDKNGGTSARVLWMAAAVKPRWS